MVAPHMAWWKLHTHVVSVQDEHGKSAATLFNTWLLGELNKACLRQHNTVFNHGAEQQNFGFTQALDKELAMFTPSGAYRMVQTESEMPQIMADLIDAQYLVLWNKQYGQKQAMKLMGQSVSADSSAAEKIKQFNKALYERIDKQSPPILKAGEFGQWYKLHPKEFRMYLRIFQEKLVELTTGAGETDLSKWDNWLKHNLILQQRFSEYYPQAPGELNKESEFILSKVESKSKTEEKDKTPVYSKPS